METIIMPRLGFTMVTGVIEKWHKKVGDRVEKGDILFEVVTDKVTVEVESLFSGYIKKIAGEEGVEIPVNEVIGYIGEKDEKVIGDVLEPAVKSSGEAAEQIAVADVAGPGKAYTRPEGTLSEGELPEGTLTREKTISRKQKMFISPLARKTAKELGIDYEAVTIKGTGPGGRITKDDVIAYADASKKEPKAAAGAAAGPPKIRSSSPLKGMRKIIAERMSFARDNIPHLVLNVKADATALVGLRKRLMDKVQSDYDIKITITDFLIKISAIALRDNIKVNSSLQDDNYIVYDDVNVGFAVALDEGLIVPTVYNCDKLDLLNIAKKRIELVDRARKGKLSLDEITNGTFTVTNLGMFGVRSFNAIINPPQAAILATGEIYPDTAVIDGKVDTRSFMDLSLSCDHRIVDGAIGALFLQKVVELIENPEMLFI
jgi:pyruvate dehydrogenase E2 component (dihydrolipoamide acetyltransferase)